MSSVRFRLALAVGAVAALAIAIVAIAAAGGGHGVRGKLTGYQEVPALSSTGAGTFRATFDKHANEIHYQLSYSGLQNVLQSHIHFENRTNSGPIVVFLCTNLGNAPPPPAQPTQACPASEGTISGTIKPGDVTAGGAAQGLAAGEFDELVRAIQAGATYANVHTQSRPAGEIRAQLVRGGHDKHH